jgi:hypothetical protein
MDISLLGAQHQESLCQNYGGKGGELYDSTRELKVAYIPASEKRLLLSRRKGTEKPEAIR